MILEIKCTNIILKQGVALTGRNSTGPPWSVGRPTARAAGPSARPPAALQTTTDDRRQRAKQYRPNITIFCLLDKHTPIMTKLPSRQSKSNPWFTSIIRAFRSSVRHAENISVQPVPQRHYLCQKKMIIPKYSRVCERRRVDGQEQSLWEHHKKKYERTIVCYYI